LAVPRLSRKPDERVTRLHRSARLLPLLGAAILATLRAILTLRAPLSALWLPHLFLRAILLAALGFVSLQILLVLEGLSALSAAILFPLLLLHVSSLGSPRRSCPFFCKQPP
jgi:hypothetical protein